ncbi:hypothetical protein Ahy_B08g094038 [Arachis hypogaea]|uniref:Photosystem II CP43 chlorophyll apoprotein n=1 Tax=Arachis hypogaea TaxID=3818 RepID=A0A444Y7Z5_ARAHY|nr:hypothetical protein Ahy_B08g094038 [Arachis hypogaea]
MISGLRKRGVRKTTNLTLSPSIIFGYLLKSPFGGEGWIVSVDDLEDIIGGHVWFGSIWWNLAYFNQTFCLDSACTCMIWKSLFVFYLFLSLLFVALSDLIISLIRVNFTSPLVQKLLKLKHLLF